MGDRYVAPLIRGKDRELSVGAETEFGLVEESLAYIADILGDARREGGIGDIAKAWAKSHGEDSVYSFSKIAGCSVKDKHNLVGVSFYLADGGPRDGMDSEIARVASEGPRGILRINSLSPIDYRPNGPGGRPFIEFIMGDNDYGAKFYYTVRADEFGFNPGPVEGREIDLRLTPLEQVAGTQAMEIRHLIDGGGHIARELYDLVREINPFATEERFLGDRQVLVDLLNITSAIDNKPWLADELKWDFFQSESRKGDDFELLDIGWFRQGLKLSHSNGAGANGEVFPWAKALQGVDIDALKGGVFNAVEYRADLNSIYPDIVLVEVSDRVCIIYVDSAEDLASSKVYNIGPEHFKDLSSMPEGFTKCWPGMCSFARSLVSTITIVDSRYNGSASNQ